MSEKSYRRIKNQIKNLFERQREGFAEELLDEDGKIIVNALLSSPTVSLSPLVSFLSSTDIAARWGAVTLIGRLVALHANTDMEWARTVMRRFMWYLNDESGGMGWGIPEAMGEVLRNHHGLALEYSKILWSYIDPEGNHLENDNLVEGALWGVARVFTAWRDVCKKFYPEVLEAYTNSNRAFSRLCAGISLICFKAIGTYGSQAKLHQLEQDGERIYFFWDGRFLDSSVGRILTSANRWILWGKNTNIT